jgi:hypothetical protein
MLNCVLCGSISHNPADFEVSYGAVDRFLQVCRWCMEDLELLGFRSNQVIRLTRDVEFEPVAFDWTAVLGPAASSLGHFERFHEHFSVREASACLL